MCQAFSIKKRITRPLTEYFKLAEDSIKKLILEDFANGTEEAVYAIYKTCYPCVEYYLPRIKHLFSTDEFERISWVVCHHNQFLEDFVRSAEVVKHIDFTKINTRKIVLENVDLSQNHTISIDKLGPDKNNRYRNIIFPEFDVTGYNFQDCTFHHCDISRWKNFTVEYFFPNFTLSKKNPLSIMRSYKCVKFPDVDVKDFHFNHIQLQHCSGLLNVPTFKFETTRDGQKAIRFISVRRTRGSLENSINADEKAMLNALKQGSINSTHIINGETCMFLGKHLDGYVFYKPEKEIVFEMSHHELRKYPEIENTIVDKTQLIINKA